jgi:hypothetical protein
VRETWLLKIELPANVGDRRRFVARMLKYLLRTWGVKCVALIDVPSAAMPTAPGEPITQTTKPSTKEK